MRGYLYVRPRASLTLGFNDLSLVSEILDRFHKGFSRSFRRIEADVSLRWFYRDFGLNNAFDTPKRGGHASGAG